MKSKKRAGLLVLHCCEIRVCSGEQKESGDLGEGRVQVPWAGKTWGRVTASQGKKGGLQLPSAEFMLLPLQCFEQASFQNVVTQLQHLLRSDGGFRTSKG
jgi:hypothetical protein